MYLKCKTERNFVIKMPHYQYRSSHSHENAISITFAKKILITEKRVFILTCVPELIDMDLGTWKTRGRHDANFVVTLIVWMTVHLCWTVKWQYILCIDHLADFTNSLHNVISNMNPTESICFLIATCSCQAALHVIANVSRLPLPGLTLLLRPIAQRV